MSGRTARSKSFPRGDAISLSHGRKDAFREERKQTLMCGDCTAWALPSPFKGWTQYPTWCCYLSWAATCSFPWEPHWRRHSAPSRTLDMRLLLASLMGFPQIFLSAAVNAYIADVLFIWHFSLPDIHHLCFQLCLLCT